MNQGVAAKKVLTARACEASSSVLGDAKLLVICPCSAAEVSSRIDVPLGPQVVREGGDGRLELQSSQFEGRKRVVGE